MKYNFLKPLLPLCMLFIFALSIHAQEIYGEKFSSAADLGLKGKVEKLEILSGFGGLKEVYTFNAAGKLSERAEVYRSDNRFFTRTVYFYDESGSKTRAESFREGKPVLTQSFKYDDKNRLSEVNDFNAKGEPFSKTVNKYDAKERLTESVSTLFEPLVSDFLMGFGAPDGEYRNLFTYDENGNPATVKAFFPKTDIPFDDRAFRYNADNQKIEETVTTQTYPNKPPRIARYFFVYNKSGDVAEARHYESVKESNVEEVKDRFKIIDDKGTVRNGLLISDKPYMILWSVTACEYEYDSRGNWTKRTCKWKTRDTADFVALGEGTARRIITYY
jgi:hypothetical protein